VLFMRSPDGHIFDLPAPVASPASSPPAQPEPVLLMKPGQDAALAAKQPEITSSPPPPAARFGKPAGLPEAPKPSDQAADRSGTPLPRPKPKDLPK
jgi:hypothetical protein